MNFSDPVLNAPAADSSGAVSFLNGGLVVTVRPVAEI